MYKMKHMISQIMPGSTNESPFGIKYFILTHLYCKILFALHMTFMPRSAMYSFPDFLYFCVGFESVSKIL